MQMFGLGKRNKGTIPQEYMVSFTEKCAIDTFKAERELNFSKHYKIKATLPDIDTIVVEYLGREKPKKVEKFLRSCSKVKYVEPSRTVGIPENEPAFKRWEEEHKSAKLSEPPTPHPGNLTRELFPKGRIGIPEDDPAFKKPQKKEKYHQIISKLKKPVVYTLILGSLGMAAIGLVKMKHSSQASKGYQNAIAQVQDQKQAIGSLESQIAEKMKQMYGKDTESSALLNNMTYKFGKDDNAWKVGAALYEKDTGAKPTNQKILEMLNGCLLPANDRNAINEDNAEDINGGYSVENWTPPLPNNPNLVLVGEVWNARCAMPNTNARYETARQESKSLEQQVRKLIAQQKAEEAKLPGMADEAANKYQQESKGTYWPLWFFGAAAAMALGSGLLLWKRRNKPVDNEPVDISIITGGKGPGIIPPPPIPTPSGTSETGPVEGGAAGETGGAPPAAPDSKASAAGIDNRVLSFLDNGSYRPNRVGSDAMPELSVYDRIAGFVPQYRANAQARLGEIDARTFVNEAYSNIDFANRKSDKFLSVKDITAISGMSRYRVYKIVNENNLPKRSEMFRKTAVAETNAQNYMPAELRLHTN
jgi:hypothetical protein